MKKKNYNFPRVVNRVGECYTSINNLFNLFFIKIMQLEFISYSIVNNVNDTVVLGILYHNFSKWNASSNDSPSGKSHLLNSRDNLYLLIQNVF